MMEKNQFEAGYSPFGEERGVNATFDIEEIARAFGVEPDRVRRAMEGEFGSASAKVDSRHAQHLVEVLLSDEPQAEQMAALMRLGAFTPRTDHNEGIGEKAPGEESDKLADSVEERKKGLGQPLGDKANER